MTWNYVGAENNSSGATSDSETFTIPNGITSSTCKLKVSTSNGSGYEDVTDYTFTILPAIIEVEVTALNGGEEVSPGDEVLLTWTNTAGLVGLYDLRYSSGGSYSTIANNINGTSYLWTVPNTPSDECRIKVTFDDQSCNYDESDDVFTITPQAPLVTVPNGGEDYYSGTNRTVTWDSSTYYDNVRLEYSLDNGVSWNLIVSAATNNGAYSWAIPNESSVLSLVRVSEVSDPSHFDISDENFTLRPAVTVLTPNGDDGFTNWGGCTVTSISFDRSPEWNRYNIRYSIDNGISWNTVVTNWVTNANPATYNWTIPNIPTPTALIRVEPYYQTSYADVSDQPFTITEPVVLTQPNFGGLMQVGSVFNIEWNSDGISNIYDLYILQIVVLVGMP